MTDKTIFLKDFFAYDGESFICQINKKKSGDGDDPTHPNVFPMPGSSPHNLMLKSIQAAFPLPGDYLFRFKTRVENKSKCDLLHGYYGIVFEIVIFLFLWCG